MDGDGRLPPALRRQARRQPSTSTAATTSRRCAGSPLPLSWLHVAPRDQDCRNLYAAHMEWVDKVAAGLRDQGEGRGSEHGMPGSHLTTAPPTPPPPSPTPTSGLCLYSVFEGEQHGARPLGPWGGRAVISFGWPGVYTVSPLVGECVPYTHTRAHTHTHTHAHTHAHTHTHTHTHHIYMYTHIYIYTYMHTYMYHT